MVKLDKIFNVLQEGFTYYHCCKDGRVALDEEFKVVVLDMKVLTGKTDFPYMVRNYDVRPCYCPTCLNEVLGGLGI